MQKSKLRFSETTSFPAFGNYRPGAPLINRPGAPLIYASYLRKPVSNPKVRPILAKVKNRP